MFKSYRDFQDGSKVLDEVRAGPLLSADLVTCVGAGTTPCSSCLIPSGKRQRAQTESSEGSLTGVIAFLMLWAGFSGKTREDAAPGMGAQRTAKGGFDRLCG